MYWFSIFKVARQSKEALIIVIEKNENVNNVLREVWKLMKDKAEVK